MTFVLVLPGWDDAIVDSADSPGKLDFLKVSGRTQYEVCACFGDVSDDSEPIWPIASVDLTGYGHISDWFAQQLCKEIDFRREFPGFEDEVRNADGPLIVFGKPEIGSND